ncbi:MAG TPA: NADH-ubiquinone oxidoreductase-F iron-sulfur binding region domain-containing protein [Candidatus Limnocylindrales bacterium]|nr:NADH-ubiquinone oxidoreductase-F iron-sulfur binding region domain-containing protein [Candidatus Limnocylindrales bacterium]
MASFLRTPSDWPRILLARVGADGSSTYDPADIESAMAAGAWAGLRSVIRDLGATGTIATIAASGLRGRGGAGFPTGEKWRTAAEQPVARRFVVANGYEADPSVDADRTLLALDPHGVLEGLAIAAYAIGATEAVVALRADATDAIRALEAAVVAAEDAGFLGSDVMGSGQEIVVTIRPVQGAYMLGEETVLLKALEGKRGQPEQRPPYPAVRGLFGAPTVVNNVQTLAAVPWIVTHGAAAFAAVGSKASPGTVVVHVRGPVGEGLAEVPLGTPVRQIASLAGGVGAGRSVKALLVGGPSGALLPPDVADAAYEFDALGGVGAHVGSRSLIVVDDRACILDLARLLTRFCADEACGKTIPCRIGTRRIAEIGERIATGVPMPTDLTLLEDLSHDVVESALCDHERRATLPMTTGMRYFRAELDEHVLRGSCPAGVCHPISLSPAGRPAAPSTT